MTGLLCLLGIHRPEWVHDGPGYLPRGWTYVRRCKVCHQLVGRTHRG